MPRHVVLLAMLLSAVSLSALPSTAARAVPNVFVTVKPVHALVAGVMGDVGTPYLLLRGGSSPHSYAMRPSDAQALQSADVVFWVGEGLESFFAKPLTSLAGDARVVELIEAPGVALLEARAGGMWEEHAHEEHEEEGHKDGAHEEKDHDEAEHADAHGHGAANAHIWLSPANARAVVEAVAAALSEADAAHAPRYRENADVLLARIGALEAEIRQTLAPVRDRPYVVFHDAYHYFETSFATKAVGAITVSPDRPPGARRLYEIRDKIRDLDAVCVFAEPQFQPDVVEMLVEDTGARIGTLDPIGSALEPGPDAYFAIMRGLAASLRDCLFAG